MTSASQTSTLIFLSLPPKTFLGIDLVSFNSSPNFHGIQSIPSGTHFLYSGTDASLAIRHGFWLELSSAVHIFQWHAEEECLRLLAPEDEVAQRATNALPTLREKGLIDYAALQDATQSRQDGQSSTSTDDWPILTSHISLKTLIRILGPGASISSISSAPQDAESIPGLDVSEVAATFSDRHETPLNFLPINLKQTWPTAAVGRQRTDAARDRSWYLGHLMEGVVPGWREKAAAEILGELQFTFLMVLTLANYSCLEQWKRVLGVLLTCRSALSEIEGFFVEALQILRLQLQHCEDVEGGLFEFRDEGGRSWLRLLLRRFKGAVEEDFAGRGKLADEISDIEDLMRERYGWEVDSGVLRRGVVELEDGERAELTMEGADEEDEMGEYAPVYVET